MTEAEAPRGVAASGTRAPHRETVRRVRGVSEAMFCVLGAAVSCALFVGLSVALVDRPAATWIHAHLGTRRFAWFTSTYYGPPLPFGPFGLMATPSAALPLAAALLFAALAFGAYAGRRLGEGGRALLATCVAVFAANEIVAFLKGVFGRTWPESWLGNNPSWVRDGVFGFFPFHGGQEWASFPSGHTAVVTAAATVLWIVSPDLKLAWAALVALVVVGLIGGNYHFVSDVIAGLYFGAGIGLGTARLMLSPGDPVGPRGGPDRIRSSGNGRDPPEVN